MRMFNQMTAKVPSTSVAPGVCANPCRFLKFINRAVYERITFAVIRGPSLRRPCVFECSIVIVLKIPNKCLTKGLIFSFSMEPHNLCNWSSLLMQTWSLPDRNMAFFHPWWIKYKLLRRFMTYTISKVCCALGTTHKGSCLELLFCPRLAFNCSSPSWSGLSKPHSTLTKKKALE